MFVENLIQGSQGKIVNMALLPPNVRGHLIVTVGQGGKCYPLYPISELQRVQVDTEVNAIMCVI